MKHSTENNNVIQDRFPESREQELNLRTDVEKIILFFQGKLKNTKLSPALEEKISRMKQCAELIGKYGGAKKVIPILQELYDISFATARRLYIETQEAFGEVTHFNRQFHIDTYINMLIEGAQQAKKAGDFRSYAGLIKEYKEAIQIFMGTNEADLYKQLKVPEFQVGFFPEELKTKLPPQGQLEARIKKILEAKRKDEIEEATIVLEPEPHEEDTL
jgi:hypothetical protein